MLRDEEKRIQDKLCPDGFPSLAEFIASHRDHSTAIYRHYDDLAARNLLYLQSELAELKALQDEYDREDAMPGHLAQPGRVAQQKRARDWREFEAAAGEVNNQREKVRMELILKIRSKLKEYSECLEVHEADKVLLNTDSALLSRRGTSSGVADAFLSSTD